MAGVVDSEDGDNRMKVTVGFRCIGITVLVVDASRATDLVVNGP